MWAGKGTVRTATAPICVGGRAFKTTGFVVYFLIKQCAIYSREEAKAMSAKLKLILSMLIFGSMGLFVRVIPLSSGAIALARGVIGVVFLGILCVATKQKISAGVLRKNAVLLVCSGVALCADWVFFFEAYKRTTIATATLSYYLAPTFLIVASVIFLREKLTVLKVVCVVVSLFGMVLVSGVLGAPVDSWQSLAGIGFGIAAAVSYASLTMMNKFLKGMSGMEVTLAQLGIASILLLPYTLLTQDFGSISMGWQAVGALLVLGVVHTGFAFWMYFSSLQTLSAQTVAVFSYIDPVTAILLSALFLQEQMDPAQILGAVLILGATFVSELFGKRQGTKQPAPEQARNETEQAAMRSEL